VDVNWNAVALGEIPADRVIGSDPSQARWVIGKLLPVVFGDGNPVGCAVNRSHDRISARLDPMLLADTRIELLRGSSGNGKPDRTLAQGLLIFVQNQL
jgi:hypothetical protein